MGSTLQSPAKLDYNKLAAAVVAEMKKDGSFKGIKGDKGDAGLRGSDGRPGLPAELDYEKLAEEVAKRLPPITVSYLDSEGNVKTSEPIPLGGFLNLHHNLMKGD